MLNRLLGKELLDLADAQKLKGRLHDAVEEEGKVDEQGKAEDLQPLKCLPAEAEGHHPDEEGAAGVDRRARGGAHAAGHG